MHKTGSWEHCKVIFKYFGCLELEEEALIWELWTVSISAGIESGQRAPSAFWCALSTFGHGHELRKNISSSASFLRLFLEYEWMNSKFSTFCYVNKFCPCNQHPNGSASKGLAQHFCLLCSKIPSTTTPRVNKKLAEHNSACTKLWETTKTTVHWRSDEPLQPEWSCSESTSTLAKCSGTGQTLAKGV